MDTNYIGLFPIAVILTLLCGAFLWRWCTSAEHIPALIVAYDPPPPYEP